MKKFLYLLLLLPLAFFASCDSDDNLPDVDVIISMDGVADVDGILYAVQDSTVSVTSVSVKSLTDKAATVSSVRYLIDGAPQFESIVSPFSMSILPGALQVGNHLLTAYMGILQVDKSVATGAFTYRLKVVESVDDLPDGAKLGPWTDTTTVQPK